MGRASPARRPVPRFHAPSPRAPHHRSSNAGIETTPTWSSSSTSSASSRPNTGTPRTKFAVPSIGVDVPARLAASPFRAELLAHHAVPRPPVGDALADQALDLGIGGRDI